MHCVTEVIVIVLKVKDEINACLVLAPPLVPLCTMDSECATGLACFNGKCLNPCLETEPCGINADCVVIDTLPLRTMSCVCRAGFIGDAESECRRGNVASLYLSLKNAVYLKIMFEVLFQVDRTSASFQISVNLLSLSIFLFSVLFFRCTDCIYFIDTCILTNYKLHEKFVLFFSSKIL